MHWRARWRGLGFGHSKRSGESKKSLLGIGDEESSLLCQIDEENVARLFSLWMPPFSKPKAFPTPVFVDEFDPGPLQSGSDCFDSSQGN